MKRTAMKRKPRKATGQRELFVSLYEQCGGVSEVSGYPLLPPTHERFHEQGSHLLPKGTYPDYMLDPRNVVMVTPLEHRLWHSYGDKEALAREHEEWASVVNRYFTLYLEANAK